MLFENFLESTLIFYFKQFLTQNMKDRKYIYLIIKIKTKKDFQYFLNRQKSKRVQNKFRTVERDEFISNAYSGNLHSFNKNKVIKDRAASSSPAVPMPSHSRLTSDSNKIRAFENSLTSDFKMVSKGINFEVEPFEKFHNINKSSMSQTKATKSDFLQAKLRVQSRATTSELQKRPGDLCKIAKESTKNKMSISTRIREKKVKSRPFTKVHQKRVKSNIEVPKGGFKSNLTPLIPIVNAQKEEAKIYTINTSDMSHHNKSMNSAKAKKLKMKNANYYYQNIHKNRLNQGSLNRSDVDKSLGKATPIQNHKVNKSHMIASNPFQFHRKSLDSTFASHPHENSYGFTNISKCNKTSYLHIYSIT